MLSEMRGKQYYMEVSISHQPDVPLPIPTNSADNMCWDCLYSVKSLLPTKRGLRTAVESALPLEAAVGCPKSPRDSNCCRT